jgi:uncharacterized protein
LMKCTVLLDKKDHNIVGKLTPEGEMVLNRDNYALWVEPSFANDTVCQKCPLVPTCQGIACPMVRIQNNVRPCMCTPKSRLTNELLLTMETARLKSREVRVSAID